MPQLLIHSHRGLGFGQPENTLAAFRAALEAGCGLELDVRLTEDDDIAIIHDNDLAHVTGFAGVVGQLTMDEIKQHPIKNSEERVPSFDELAQLLVEYQLPQDAIAIHLKAAEQTGLMMELLADKIAEYRLEDRVFVFDVMRPAINFLRWRNEKLRLSISLGADHHAPTIFTMEDLSQFSDVPIIWWDEWGQAAGTLYKEENLWPLKEKDLQVYVISPDVAYQTNHPLAHDHKYVPVWKDLIAWGVDGICTDVPQELLKVMKSVPVGGDDSYDRFLD